MKPRAEQTNELCIQLLSLSFYFNFQLPAKQAELMEFHTEARYPDVKMGFYQKCTKEFAAEKYKEIKKVYKWLRKKSEI